MAKIRMTTLACGPERTLLPGQEYEIPAGEARALVEGGYAVLLDPPATPAPAVERRSENIERPRPRRNAG